MQEIGVDAEWRLATLVLGDRNLVLLGEGDQRLAALEVPFPPRRDHTDIRFQRIVGDFKPDLIVTLAGSAVANCAGPYTAGDIYLGLGDQRAGDRSSEQVLALIDGVGPKHREHIVTDKFLAQVLDEDVFRLHTQQQRLVARRRDFLALAQVSREGHHFAAVGLLQPFQDDRGVQPTRIGEHNLIYRRLRGHFCISCV